MVFELVKGILEDTFGYMTVQFLVTLGGTVTEILNLPRDFEGLHMCGVYASLLVFTSLTVCRLYRFAISRLV